MVDIGVEDSTVRPKKASARLAILLLLGLLTFAGVVIIIMPISEGGLKLPDVEIGCNEIAHTHSMLLMHAGGGGTTYDATYEIVIENTHITFPVKGSRCKFGLKTPVRG